MGIKTLGSRFTLLIGLALVAGGAGCSSLPGDPDHAARTVQLRPEDVPQLRAALPRGTRIQLHGLSVTRPARSATQPSTEFVDGLWRVALRQSVRFDIAAGTENRASPSRILLQFDGAAKIFTTTLERDGLPPVALAAVREAPTPNALDRLGYLTRVALGEDIASRPIRCDTAYSPNKDCVRFTERGLERRKAGDARGALGYFERARSHDGGCALTLLHLAIEIQRLGSAHATRASETALEALSIPHRLTPHTDHRIARVILALRRDDANLLKLGQDYQKERPHDPHGRYTTALALEKAGKHAAALPHLEELRDRWPGNPSVRYQLCFALLGTGDAETALEVLEEAKRQIPRGAIVRPYAMALYHSGKHDELKRYLTEWRRTRGVAGTPAEREIIRMQASHALLIGDRKLAIQKLAESLAWVRGRSSTLQRHALDVAEDGEVLARLGATEVLIQAIGGFQQLGQLPPAFANVLTYLGGLLSIAANETPTRALATLEKSHDTVWHNQLQAALHHHRGELDAETKALERAVDSSRSSLLQASVARALDTAGKKSDAHKVSAHIRKTLLSFDQRQLYQHPLMTPGRAMAFLACSE